MPCWIAGTASNGSDLGIVFCKDPNPKPCGHLLNPKPPCANQPIGVLKPEEVVADNGWEAGQGRPGIVGPCLTKAPR